MIENWPRAIASVRLWEGGDAIRPNEPGGAVSRGVSLTAFREEHPGASIKDLFDASDEEINRIFKENYWNPLELDHAPPGMDAVMLHAAVMFGVQGALKLSTAANDDYAKMVVLMMQNKMHRKDGLKFMPGWSDRFVAVYDLGKELHDAPLRGTA